MSSLSFVLVLAVVGLLGVPRAHGQAPTAMSVDNSSANPVLKAFGDGGLLAPAQSATAGDIPATGAGSRLMWYPGKYAFRVGEVTGSQWDDPNVGEGSVAFGRDTQASGIRAVAMHFATTASGSDATAMGEGTVASGDESMAMGLNTQATTLASTVMGQATIASTPNSLSIGQFNNSNQSSDGTLLVAGNGASGSRSDALRLDKDAGLVVGGAFGTGIIPASGAGTRAMWYPGKAAFRAGRVGVDLDGTQWDDGKVGAYSVAFGNDTKANGASTTAIGHETTASGQFATAMGSGSTASGKGATAMGAGTLASGFLSTAMGGDTEASAAEATAMGFNTTASENQATAMGLGTVASVTAATAMGKETRAATENSLTIGMYNQSNRGNDDADPTTGPLFVVGNGSSGARSDALVLEQGGNMTISGTLTELSDRRLKTAIEPVGDGALKKLARIRPVRYKFKNQRTHPSGEQIGLVAQDVQKEFPQLVSTGGGDMLSLAYPKFTAVLLKGLQEQQAQIERQEARIDSLERESQRLDRIEKRLDRLEAGERSVSAGIPMTDLLLGVLVGGLLGAGLVWRRRH